MTETPATIVTIPATSSASGAGGVVKPNSNYPIVLRVVSPLTVIGIRAARVFVQSLLGLMAADTVVSSLLPAADFWGLLTTSAKLAIAPAGISVLQSILELLTKLDQKSPTLTV